MTKNKLIQRNNLFLKALDIVLLVVLHFSQIQITDSNLLLICEVAKKDCYDSEFRNIKSTVEKIWFNFFHSVIKSVFIARL